MARAGRKRAFGVERKPSGKIANKVYDQRKVDICDTVRDQRRRHFGAVHAEDRRNGKGRSHANDRRYGYALGRLLIAGVITQKQHDMGMDFAEIFADFRRVADMPPPVIRAIDYGAVTPRRVARQMTAEEAEATKRRYASVSRAIAKAGVGRLSAVYDVVVRDVDPDITDESERIILVEGLEAIVRHFSPRKRRGVTAKKGGLTNNLVV